MDYLKRNVVANNECVKFEPEKNPIILVLKWVWGILGFWLLFIPTIKAIKESIQYAHTEYLVTDKRVMEKYGWFSTHTDEISLNKIGNITVTYTFWGKIFNYATLQFEGATHNHITFNYIKNAEALKKQINEIL